LSVVPRRSIPGAVLAQRQPARVVPAYHAARGRAGQRAIYCSLTPRAGERAAAARRDGEASVKAKEGVIERLNTILTNELTGINQYFIHAEMCRNWGFERLYEKLRAFSIDEMKDAQQIIQHILYLEGVPNLQRLGTVRVGENVPEDVQLDLAQEQEAVNTYNEAIAHCAQVGDYTTRNILEELVRDEETHVDWLETQLETIEQVGLERYLAQQIRGD
jgi:bacterioferritin